MTLLVWKTLEWCKIFKSCKILIFKRKLKILNLFLFSVYEVNIKFSSTNNLPVPSLGLGSIFPFFTFSIELDVICRRHSNAKVNVYSNVLIIKAQ